MVQSARFVEQPEEQRADQRSRSVLVPPKPGHDAVGGAGVLDLGPTALGWHVRIGHALGYYTIETGAFESVEPVGGDRRIAGGGGQRDGRLGAREGLLEERAPFTLGSGSKVAPVEGEEIPGHVAGGRLGREQLHSGSGWVDPEQQRVEVQAPWPGDDHLAVEDAAIGQRGPQRGRQLREVAVEGLEVAALDVRFVAVAEDEGPEAVPLWLVQPAVADGDLVGELGQHRLDRRLKRQVHGATIAPPVPNSILRPDRPCVATVRIDYRRARMASTRVDYAA